MREIKFRAWDRTSRCWTTDIVCHTDTSNRTLQLKQPVRDPSFQVEIMQYAGLKDKNGVEIYEGDIVKDNIFGLYTVFFSYGGFKLIGVNDLSNQLALMDSHSNWYEVIGNIYQNPELLEAV